MTAKAFRTPTVSSRLPAVGTTIFTVMSALAHEHGAVNLGQGFPDFDCNPALIDAVDKAMRNGLSSTSRAPFRSITRYRRPAASGS